MQIIISILFIAVGAFEIVASICDFDFYFESIKIDRMVRLIGRNGARILYGIVGIILLVIGILNITGLWEKLFSN